MGFASLLFFLGSHSETVFYQKIVNIASTIFIANVDGCKSMAKVASVKRERLSEMIAFRVYPSLYQVVTEVAAKDRRKLSEVELALFERGVAAFQRDGHLFEPETVEYKKQPVTNMTAGTRKRTHGDQKKTGTSNR